MERFLNRAATKATGSAYHPAVERDRERIKRATRLYRNGRTYRPLVRPVMSWLGGDQDYTPVSMEDYSGPRGTAA